MTAYVFTDTPFGGNPLAVIPDATVLEESLLQKIAREFDFSETSFVYPSGDSTNTARGRTLDIAQGVEMDRPSRIDVQAGPEGVTISGSARRVMEGRLFL